MARQDIHQHSDSFDMPHINHSPAVNDILEVGLPPFQPLSRI